jgi:hypothetical protein
MASICRDCGEPIVFMRTRLGKLIPVDADSVTDGDTEYEPRSGHVSHFDSCLAAEQVRQDARGG